MEDWVLPYSARVSEGFIEPKISQTCAPPFAACLAPPPWSAFPRIRLLVTDRYQNSWPRLSRSVSSGKPIQKVFENLLSFEESRDGCFQIHQYFTSASSWREPRARDLHQKPAIQANRSSRVAIMSLNSLCQEKNPDLEKIKQLLAESDDKTLEELDSHGVTPLQQAAFRGNAELVRLLLEHGADVNTSNHSEGYTTLMFGALSGNLEVVRTLLDAGAKTTPVNKVNRTAAEMAAFVGLKDVVTVIKGFVPRSDIERFSKPQGIAEEPRLTLDEVDPLRSLILEMNIHPVKVVLRLRGTTLMSGKVASVLKSLSDTYFSTHCNEWLSGKLHILKCIVEHVSDVDPDLVLKHWMKPRLADGFKLNMDDFMRGCVRSYSFHESSVFRQMVMTLAHTPQTAPVTDDGAVAICLGARSSGSCNACWEPEAENRCSACKAVTYCNKECQKLDWPSHKRLCAALKQQREAGDCD